MIVLCAPGTVGPDDVSIVLKGWCNAKTRPQSVKIRIAGRYLPTILSDASDIEERYAQLKAVRYECHVDFSQLFKNNKAAYPQQLYSLVVTVETEFEWRPFEYIVRQEWIERVFEGPKLSQAAHSGAPHGSGCHQR